MNEVTYDFESGDLSLDFANTNEWHASSNPIDHIHDYAELLNWGKQAGLISPEQAAQLQQRFAGQPNKAEAFYKKAIELREALYRIYSRRYASLPAIESDMAILNQNIREAMSNLQLTPVDGEVHWDWAPGINDEDILLGSIARSAANLITSDKASRVRECEDDRGCGYLFIDQSKNHSRRWCSMESCGNRNKARRHYERVK